MAWEEVPQSPGRQASGVRCSLALIQGGNVRLFVSPAPDVLAALGWEAGDRVGLARGTGPDAGRLRISVRSGGGVPLRRLGRSKAALVAVFDPGPPLDAVQAESTVCAHAVQDGVLTLTLPESWFTAAEQAAAQRAEAA